MSASSLRELAEGRWQAVIADGEADQHKEQITRLILCSGKVYVDLAGHEQREAHPEIALVRVEQLYPFPADKVAKIVEGYPNLAEVIWLQEEPKNMGAWEYLQPRLLELIGGRYPLRYVGRPRRSSPAEGSSAWHMINQAAIIEQAFAENVIEVDVEPHQTVEVVEV
jgi:2-oxoglutarate dehydrogenase E1 component